MSVLDLFKPPLTSPETVSAKWDKKNFDPKMSQNPIFSTFYLKKTSFLRFISKMDEILFSKLDISATNGPIDLKFGLEHVLYLGVSQNKIS